MSIFWGEILVNGSENAAKRNRPTAAPWRQRAPVIVLMVVAVYLLATWALVVAVDFLDLGGLRTHFQAQSRLTPAAVWEQLYQNNGPTEWLQWLALAGGSITAALTAGWWFSRSTTDGPTQWRDKQALVEPAQRRRLGWFWLLFAGGLALMLIEDAGDPRHQISDVVRSVTESRMLGFLAEMGCFAVVGALPLVAIVLFFRDIRLARWARGYLLPGVAAYALAGGMSATSGIGDWYNHLGEWVVAQFAPGLTEFDYGPRFRTGFWLMDSLVEESIELIGAALLLAATLAGLNEAQQRSTIAP